MKRKRKKKKRKEKKEKMKKNTKNDLRTLSVYLFVNMKLSWLWE